MEAELAQKLINYGAKMKKIQDSAANIMKGT